MGCWQSPASKSARIFGGDEMRWPAQTFGYRRYWSHKSFPHRVLGRMPSRAARTSKPSTAPWDLPWSQRSTTASGEGAGIRPLRERSDHPSPHSSPIRVESDYVFTNVSTCRPCRASP